MSDLTSAPLDVVIVVVVGYLVGSIPVANLVARRRAQLDLRDVGDRNPGYWNAKETLGRRQAIPVFVGDLLKGVVAGAVGLLLAGGGDWWLPYVGTGAAMIGHAYPVFAGFRGGRSVLTMVGGALVFAPLAAAISVAALLVVLVATRSFAWAARVGIAVFPFVQLVVDGPYPTAATGVLMTFVGFRFWIAGRVTRGV
jgi:acyl phosphate:glycerol-3-phosphate acyltransferase